MTALVLQARQRTAVGKVVKTLHRHHRVPAVLYGHGVANRNLEIDRQAFQRVLQQAGTSSLVELIIDQEQPIKVLIHAIQRHPLASHVMHVDFYQVKMSEKLETDIALQFSGESPAVKELGGILVRAGDKIKVSCLPGDLVPSIDVDISQLKTFDDHLRIRDLRLPTGMTFLEDPSTIIASVSPPRSEAEIEALETTVSEDVTAVEQVSKEKAEGEEETPASGAAAPAESKT
ncbi:MAG: 50S ribosomal protein L25 [Candidatus Kerfeldbacteria bacterium]|nr:50S ribosomal protein L25 [Candidatus Kerfeldbacteria bacterium]